MTIPPEHAEILQMLLDRTIGARLDGSSYSKLIYDNIKKGAADYGNSIEKYAQVILSDPIVKQNFIDQVAVNETYFFREERQFQIIEKYIFPELLKEKKPFHFWSMVCSRGDEALSLTILVEAWMRRHPRQSYKIYASDISSKALQDFRSNRFFKRSLRPDGAAYAETLLEYLTQEDEYYYNADPKLFEHLTIFQANLLQDQYTQVPNESISIIFLRNLFIYLNDAQRLHILNGAVEKLVPGGYLFVSVVESSGVLRLAHPKLEAITFDQTMVFRRCHNRNLIEKGSNPSKSAEQALVKQSKSFLDGDHFFVDYQKILSDIPLLHQKLPIDFQDKTASELEKYKTILEKIYEILLSFDKGKSVEPRILEELPFDGKTLYLKNFLSGMNYFHLSNHAATIHELERALQREPLLWPAAFKLGLLLKDSDPKKAIVYFEQFLKIVRMSKNESSTQAYKSLLHLEEINLDHISEIASQWIGKLKG